MNSTQKNDPIPLNNEVLMNGLLQIYNSHVEIMLDNIASEYNLSASALKDKYIHQNNVDFNSMFSEPMAANEAFGGFGSSF